MASRHDAGFAAGAFGNPKLPKPFVYSSVTISVRDASGTRVVGLVKLPSLATTDSFTYETPKAFKAVYTTITLKTRAVGITMVCLLMGDGCEKGRQ